MDTRDFINTILADDGVYCVFAARSSDGKRVQKFPTSVSELIDTTFPLDSDGYDTYFALATFKEAGSRKVNNVHKLKSLFLDIDCGPSKDYPDQKAGIAGLRTFCAALSLPTPLLVNSGRGVHVYWPLKEAATLDEWLPVAEALKKACVQHGFKADPAITSDAARVLRLPGTHNHKDNPPTSVHALGVQFPAPVDLDAFSGLLGGPVIAPPTKYIPAEANAVMDALLGNRTSSFSDIVAKTKTGTGCAQLANIVENQAEISEPLWRAGLSIAKFCEDGEQAAHDISKQYPDYSQEETTKKLDNIKGPYLCSTFDSYNPGVCLSCPHWGKIKSPISLGNKIKEAAPEEPQVEATEASSTASDVPSSLAKPKDIIPKYPHPYFRGANGGVYMRTTADDGSVEERLIYHNDLYPVDRVLEPGKGESIVWKVHLPMDGVREFLVPHSCLHSTDGISKAFSTWGVGAANWREMMKYATTWVNELQYKKRSEDAHIQFGWIDEDLTGFVLGDTIIYKDRVGRNAASAQTLGLFPAFKPRGTLEKWKENAEFYNRPDFELHQYVVGAGFGSALMGLTHLHASGLNLWGNSGVGKSTAMMVALGIWGNPEPLLLHKGDTHVSKMNRGEVYHNLPLFIDELTNITPDDLSDLIYQLSSGKQRNRMNGSTNTERERGRNWQLLCMSSSNVSLMDTLTLKKAEPAAEAARMLEIKAERLFTSFGDKAEQDKFAASVVQNYGHVGPMYVQYILNNVDEIRKLIEDVRRKIDEKAQLTSEHRFWSVHVTMTITGLILAKRMGLVNYDISKVTEWALWLLEQNKLHANDRTLSPQEILNSYMAENWGNVLWIKSTDDLRKHNENGLDSLIVPEAVPKNKLVARYETDLKRAYLIPKPLKKWCTDQQLNYSTFVESLVILMGAKRAKVRLSRGTHMQLPPMTVIVVDCNIEAAGGEGNTAD
jgi:hypothetical protein